MDLISLKNIQEASLGFSEQSGEILDGVAFGGSVYDTEHLL